MVDRLLQLVMFVTDIGAMIWQSLRDIPASFRHGRSAVGTVFLRQLYFTGLEPIRIILFTSLLIGTAVISQIVSIAGGGSEYLVGKVMVWVVVRELAPLLTALVVIARSGSAIAAELSQMKIGGELEQLEMMGISVDRYLVMPRIWGVGLAVVLLSVYFALAAVLGGYLVATVGWHVPADTYGQGVISVLTLQELVFALVKSSCFGVLIAAICCRQGLQVGQSLTQIPQATTRAVMQSLLMVFLLEGLLSVLYAVV